MRTGNAILSAMWILLAHVLLIGFLLIDPLLVHYGFDPGILPMDPGGLAIPVWFIYMFIGVLFAISGMETRERTQPSKIIIRDFSSAEVHGPKEGKKQLVDQPVIAKKPDHEKLKFNHDIPKNNKTIVIEPIKQDLRIRKTIDETGFIKPVIANKPDLSDIKNHVNSLRIPVDHKILIDEKKEDLRIRKTIDETGFIKPSQKIMVETPLTQTPAEPKTTVVPMERILNKDSIINADDTIEKYRSDIEGRRKKLLQFQQETSNE